MFFHHLLLHPACRAEALGLLPPPSMALYLLTLLEIYRQIKICWLTLCLLLLEEIINSCCNSDSQYMDLKNLVKLSFKAAQAQAVAPTCLHTATSPGRTPCRSHPLSQPQQKLGEPQGTNPWNGETGKVSIKGLWGSSNACAALLDTRMGWFSMAWHDMGWDGMA